MPIHRIEEAVTVKKEYRQHCQHPQPIDVISALLHDIASFAGSNNSASSSSASKKGSASKKLAMPKPAGDNKTKLARDVSWDLYKKINFAVFPSLQGSPHQHQIAGLAAALKEVESYY